MHIWLILSLFVLNPAWAEVGKVLKLTDGSDAYLMREQNKIPLAPELLLELGDELFSQNTHVVVHIFPGTQISLSKNTDIKLTEHFIEEEAEAVKKSSSVVEFIKGIIRLSITREGDEELNQKVQAEGVAFGVRGTEFEVSLDDASEVDLDVFEGAVEVTSPHVHTFVPEIVKANEGFKYNRRQKSFARRKFSPKFKNHPGFENSKKLRQQWKELRKQRRAEKVLNKKARGEQKRARKMKKGSKDR